MNDLFYISYALVWALVLIEGLLIVGLIRVVYDRRSDSSASESQPQRPAPNFSAFGIFGEQVESSNLAGHPYGAIFVLPSCQSCHDAITQIEPVRRRVGKAVLAFCRGAQEDCEALSRESAPGVRFLVDEQGDIAKQFGVTRFPTTVIVDDRGMIRMQGTLIRQDELEDLPASELYTNVGVGSAEE